MLTCSPTSSGSVSVTNSVPAGATALTPRRARAAFDSIDEIGGGPELALDDRAVNQRVVHRQDADGGGVLRETPSSP